MANPTKHPETHANLIQKDIPPYKSHHRLY